MEQQFAMTTVLVANALGIVLIGVLLACNTWRLRDKTREGRCILIMMALIVLGCILDPVAYVVDGMPGFLNRFINYASNTALYLLNMGMALCWFIFLVEHMRFRLVFAHRVIVGGLVALGVFCMVANCFVPLAFDVDENNAYTRGLGYFLFLFMDHGLVIDSLFLYLIARSRGGLLRQFPIWVYILPFAICTVVQSATYGISVLCASYAISMAGLLASLQAKLMYKDAGTGAYNKGYLDFISRQYVKEKKKRITGIFLNVNDFRSINKDKGRDVGDKVLEKLVQLLNHAVGESGNVVRYSGDEFVVLLNAKTEMEVSVCIARIKANIDDYNKLRDCPAKISVRMASREMNFGHQNINQMLSILDDELQSAEKIV